MKLETVLFFLFASISIGSATMVVSSKNPVHSILYLVLVFFNASGLLLLIKVEFLAMIFLVVYVGAIAVLFLFVVMMLNIRIAELSENTLRYMPIGGVIGVIFVLEFFLIIEPNFLPLNLGNVLVLEGIDLWSYNMEEYTNIRAIGMLIYTNYFYYFLMASLVLLVAMIGAIVLTMNKRGGVQKQDIFEQVSRSFEQTLYLRSS